MLADNETAPSEGHGYQAGDDTIRAGVERA